MCSDRLESRGSRSAVLSPSRDGQGIAWLLALGGLSLLAQLVPTHKAPIMFEACLGGGR